MYVIKRDGYKEVFDRAKIESVIMKSINEVSPTMENEDKLWLADAITCTVELRTSYKAEVSIEDIQDLIEEDLMDRGHSKIAKAFILYRQNRNEVRQKGWQMDDLQQSIFDKKYNSEDVKFDKWLDRVSNGNPKIRKLIRDMKFIFAGRILAHRGVNKKVTYSNCYVMGEPEDNLESIFDTAKDLARTYSYGGGCGTDISLLRPKNSKVNNSAEETSGAVSFMELYDLTTKLIGQNGRRGALMLSISDKHPDLLEFIDIKTCESAITKANISVKVSDGFMDAVRSESEWKLSFTVIDTGEVIEKTYQAIDIYHKMCMTNWDWAEIGFLFWDRITGWHLMSEHPDHHYVGVNPCAEEPLMKDGSCLLGSMNVSKYVLYPFTPQAKFDYEKFGGDVRTGVIGLNEVLDEGMSRHPLQGQRDNARDWRQIGLGAMGIADMFIKMGIAYGSRESIDLSEKVGIVLLNEALMQSSILAKESGSFPMYNESALFSSPFFQENVTEEVKNHIARYGLRNSQILTIAPNGSISTMWGISGGIESIFDISYTRKTESLFGEDVYFEVVTPIIKQYMEVHGIVKTEDLPSFILESTAHKLDYKKRIMVQATWQKRIDASISSTINLPKSATVFDVEELYLYAHEMKLKGLTVFRDGCKKMGILTTGGKKETDAPVVGIKETNKNKYNTCGECGEPIEVITNGCVICMNCGASPCA